MPAPVPGHTVPLSEIATAVLEQRYLRRDDRSRLCEGPLEMFQRVAAKIAEPCRDYGEDAAFWETRFLEHMQRLEFLPNSPTLMNAGSKGGQLAACFVVPVNDDLDSIFLALARMARIHQSGGGTGFSFGALRPRQDHVASTGGVTCGPLPFIELFDHATAVIRAGGRRRGANMAVLPVDHPDIEEFVNAKRTPHRLENFNLSVGVSDAFFEALDARTPFPLRNPRDRTVTRSIDPLALFEQIGEAAWETGDPGLLFLDEIARHNATPGLGTIETTNPCGEQPLLPWESCTLGSVNLAAFAGAGGIDWEGLRTVIRDAVVFLDNVIDANGYPFPEIAAAARRTRKIGLGVMGLADLFAALGVAYDSDDALRLGGQIAEYLTSVARAASAELGSRRGSFPAFADSLWPQRGFTSLRNATVTCVAPTGTLSLLAGVVGGIEPFFALATAHRLLDGKTHFETTPALLAALEKSNLPDADVLAAARECGSLRAVPGVPEELRRRFPTALEIAPEFHLMMQAAFQVHVDAAVSKTVNLPADAPAPVVREIFSLARRLSLKGVTVYRYGSRPHQPLSLAHPDAPRDCRECAA